jgi:hypothetical protein
VIYRELRDRTDLRIEVAIAYMPDARDASLPSFELSHRHRRKIDCVEAAPP